MDRLKTPPAETHGSKGQSQNAAQQKHTTVRDRHKMLPRRDTRQ